MTMFSLKKLATSVACASVAVVGLAAPSFAQDRSLWLYDNEATTVTGYFLAGESIYGVCDSDCADLDLMLYSESGVLVDSDEALDSFPIVTAPYDGTFSVRVTMPSCTHSAGCAVEVSSDYGF